MKYSFYQSQDDLLAPWRSAARNLAPLVELFTPMRPFGAVAREARALLDLFARGGMRHQRPEFGIDVVLRDGREIPVVEQVVRATPFGALLHFATPDDRVERPRVLIAAPLSGHFATLLRHTVQVMLADHDVFITDWFNARDIPLAAGRFGFDDYVDHIMLFMRELGPGASVVAVCQPAVAVLAATALMEADSDPARPHATVLMGGPIDTRCNPSKVNQLAKTRDIAWFEQNLIDTVPWQHQGAGRRVYPGFVQLASFMSMNLDRHIGAHVRQFRSIVTEDAEAEAAHNNFYAEYQSVMDLPAEFYLETVERVFQRHDLPLGRLTHRGDVIDLGAITETQLLAVEGERDDICPPGQTEAVIDLCAKLPASRKLNHLQKGVGHYGVFSGSRWAQEIYPLLRTTIATPRTRRAPRQKS
jgi:poly(3-hydroxybutyrate) depolymerase